MAMIKHVGKMKNNGARIAVVYRTLPGDAYHALVVGTAGLGSSFHDDLMSVIQSPEGQSANELADILSVRKFSDGHNMLTWFHQRGYLKKVPTDGVLMTPHPTQTISLDQLNAMIAEQKGVSLDELAITDGVNPNPKTAKEAELQPEVVVEASPVQEVAPKTPAEMRSKADALYKEAAALRKQADELDPPKPKAKKTKTVESV